MHRLSQCLRQATALTCTFQQRGFVKAMHTVVPALVAFEQQLCTLHALNARVVQRVGKTKYSQLPSYSRPRAFTEVAADRRTSKKIVEFPLAQTGEGIKECELIQWFVKEGDHVEEFDKLCEIQSDKAAVEITSRYTGVIHKLHHDVGAVVQVGEPLVSLEVEDAEPTTLSSSPPAVPAPAVDHESQQGHSSGSSSEAATLASPAVRRIAREYNINLASVVGTGPGGRVLKGDILAFVPGPQPSQPIAASTPLPPLHNLPAAPVQSTVVPQPPSIVPQPRPIVPQPPPYEPHAVAEGMDVLRGHVSTLPIRGYRRAMVKSMTAACSVPHFHFCDEVDLTRLVELRQRLKGDPSLGGAKLTFLPFVLKAISVALMQYPEINARLSDDSTAILQYSNHNIGVAVAAPGGLVVPNVKAVQDKSVAQVAQQLGQLQQSAATNSLPAEAVSGGTITVSNIGSIGGTYATPLVNPPEVAIVALGKLQHLPRYDASGEINSHAIMAVSWGADHRVVDGATLASFSNAWKTLLEQPERLLLHLK